MDRVREETRPLTPKQFRDIYSKPGPTQLPKEEILEGMKWALEDVAYWWAKECGGTPPDIAKAITHNVRECGEPQFVSDVEIRRIAARMFRKYIEDKRPFTARWEGDGLGRTDVAAELSNLESWVAYRTEQFHFGIGALDGAIGGGVMKGQMMSIIGNPGSMKTSLLLNGIEQWVKESEEPVVFFSIDMAKVDIFERLMLRELQCGPNVLRDHMAMRSIEYMAAKESLGKKYGGGRLTVLDNSTGPKWTIDKIVEYVEMNAPGLVCIDFLTQLKKPKQSDFDVANEAAPILKDLAHTYGCAIVVLSQMSQASRLLQAAGGMGGTGKGGPVIEENADIEIELFRDVPLNPIFDNSPRIVATIKKTRRGIAGSSFLLSYAGPSMCFTGGARRAKRQREVKALFEEAEER